MLGKKKNPHQCRLIVAVLSQKHVLLIWTHHGATQPCTFPHFNFRRNMYRSAPVCVRLCVRELQHGRDLRSTLIQQQNHFRTAAFIHCGSESNGDTAAMEKRSNTGSNVTASLSTCTADRTYIQCATLQPRRHPPSSCAGQAAVPLVQPQTLVWNTFCPCLFLFIYLFLIFT